MADEQNGAGSGNIEIEFVEEPIKIRVDMAKLTWGDLIDIQRQQNGDGSEEAAEKTLTAIVSKVTGQDAYTLPAQAMAKLIAAVMERAQGLTPKN